LDQYGQDDDQPCDGGYRSGRPSDEASQPEGKQAKEREVEAGADHGAERSWTADVRLNGLPDSSAGLMKKAVNDDAMPSTPGFS
jgi:hypothetical protein